MPLFGTLTDQSSMMAAAGLPVDSGMMPSQHTAAAVGMHVGYPASVNDVNDMNAMMMMSDVYHGNPSAVDQSAVKQLFHSVNDIIFGYCLIHRDSKKQDTKLLSITLPNIDRFSKLIH